MGTAKTSRSRPKKGRPPKCPAGIRRRWSPQLGWRFRATIGRTGQRFVGQWQSSVDDALRDLLELRTRSEHADAVPELLTVEEALRLFLERATTRGFRRRLVQPCRPATVSHYREISRTIFRVIGGETLLHSLDKAAFEGYLRLRSAEERKRCKCDEKGRACTHVLKRPSSARLNRERGAWSRIFQTAIEAGLHPGPNPLDQVDKYFEPLEESRHYAAEEVADILTAIRSHAQTASTAKWFADVVALLFLTGLRIGELAHVQAKHVDFKKGTLQVPEGKTGSRTLPLRQPHLDVLGRILKGKNKEDYLLPGDSHDKRTGNIKSNLFRRWRPKLPEALRSGFTAHAFRHGFETHLLERGVPIHHTKTLMGHSKVRDISDRYAHADPRRLRQSMADAFDDIGELFWPTEKVTKEALSG